MTLHIEQGAETLVSISPEALVQLREVIGQEPDAEIVSLRIFVQGARAAMALEDVTREDDIVMEFEGIRVLVDEGSAPYLAGATIDFHDGLMNRGFVIENANLPQSGGGCACGGNCGCGGH